MLYTQFKRTTAAAAFAVSAALLSACATPGTQASAVVASEAHASITEADVRAAQNAWGDALVQIAVAYDNEGIDAARSIAESVIDSAYGYNLGPVLFKPTLTVVPQTFRTSRDGAIAYFVGHDSDFASDSGFALKGWRSYEIENAAIFIQDDVAISMGKVRVTDSSGNVTEVDKTWGWTRDPAGDLRIILHHSSLPYQPG